MSGIYRAGALVLWVAVSSAGVCAQGVSPGAGMAAVPSPRWSKLTLVAPEVALLIPTDWARLDGGNWESGTDRRFVVGWTPGTGQGPLAMAEGMKTHLEQKDELARLSIEPVMGPMGELLAYDLMGTTTATAAKGHWQWTRLLPRLDASILLLSVQADFADPVRIAETQEQLALTFSSMLNAARTPYEAPEPAGEGYAESHIEPFSASAEGDRMDLGALGGWAVLEQLWAHPQIKAELVLEVGFVAGEVTREALEEQLLADARAATGLELQVEPRDEGGAGLTYRIVGHEADEPGADKIGAAALFRNERVRWVRLASVPGTDGTWLLRASVDLGVTHADDFLDNAITGLDPVFAGFVVAPLD